MHKQAVHFLQAEVAIKHVVLCLFEWIRDSVYSELKEQYTFLLLKSHYLCDDYGLGN